MVKISDVLEIIQEEAKKKKICDSLVLFGSAVYDKNPNDIDLILYQNDFIRPIDFMKYIDFMDYLDKKYEKIGFAFSSGNPRKKKIELEVAFLPYSFFMKEIEKGFTKELCKNHKVLLGNDPFLNFATLTAQDFLISINLLYKNDVNSNYFKIKTLLREAMNYKGKNLEKKDLVLEFEKEYEFKVSDDFKEAINGKKVDDKMFKQEYENIFNRVKEEIMKENPQLNHNIQYPKEFLFIIQIYRELRVLWEKEDLNTIRRYLTVKEQEFSKLE